MKDRLYVEPYIEIIYIAVEEGFSASLDENWGLPGEDPTLNDYGDF